MRKSILMDPITDMLNRIRNAQAVFHQTVAISFSKLKYEIAKTLEKEGFIGKIEKRGKKTKKIIKISLKYEKEELGKTKKAAISGLKRISKPGQRIYSGSKGIRKSKKGYGMAIVSTPRGIMTDKEAEKENLGGEVLFEIW